MSPPPTSPAPRAPRARGSSATAPRTATRPLRSTVAPQPPRTPKVAEVVARQIRMAILRGDLKPGDNLPPEVQLIADFQVARPSMREAIRILETEGLVQVSRGMRHGARVTHPSTALIARTLGVALQTRGATMGDVYRARSQIEPLAARLATQANSAAAAERLRAAVAAERVLTEARDRRGMLRLIGEFHRVLMEASGNVTLAVLGTALEGLISGHLGLIYDRMADKALWWAQMDLSLRSRGRLASLIAAGDPDAAAAHWSTHLNRAGRHWLAGIGDMSLVDILEG